jgi:hypothetical protein
VTSHGAVCRGCCGLVMLVIAAICKSIRTFVPFAIIEREFQIRLPCPVWKPSALFCRVEYVRRARATLQVCSAGARRRALTRAVLAGQDCARQVVDRYCWISRCGNSARCLPCAGEAVNRPSRERPGSSSSPARRMQRSEEGPRTGVREASADQLETDPAGERERRRVRNCGQPPLELRFDGSADPALANGNDIVVRKRSNPRQYRCRVRTRIVRPGRYR